MSSPQAGGGQAGLGSMGGMGAIGGQGMGNWGSILQGLLPMLMQGRGMGGQPQGGPSGISQQGGNAIRPQNYMPMTSGNQQGGMQGPQLPMLQNFIPMSGGGMGPMSGGFGGK